MTIIVSEYKTIDYKTVTFIIKETICFIASSQLSHWQSDATLDLIPNLSQV